MGKLLRLSILLGIVAMALMLAIGSAAAAEIEVEVEPEPDDESEEEAGSSQDNRHGSGGESDAQQYTPYSYFALYRRLVGKEYPLSRSEPFLRPSRGENSRGGRVGTGARDLIMMKVSAIPTTKIAAGNMIFFLVSLNGSLHFQWFVLQPSFPDIPSIPRRDRIRRRVQHAGLRAHQGAGA